MRARSLVCLMSAALLFNGACRDSTPSPGSDTTSDSGSAGGGSVSSSGAPATSGVPTGMQSSGVSTASSSTGLGETTTGPTDSPAEMQLRGWVQKYLDSYRIKDEARRFRGDLLVAKKARPVVESAKEGAYGRRFPIASITKPITAVAVMQLVEKGKIKVEDSIRTHISELPAAFDGVTIELLLQHRSGIANCTEDAELMKRRHQPISQADMIAVIAAAAPKAQPGEAFHYSNSGYFLLGVLIERISGQSWAEYLRQHIFEPSGMEHTNINTQNTAPGWTPGQDKLELAQMVDPSFSFAAGAVVSTTRDLLRFGQALVSGSLLPASVVQKMWSSTGSYGYGFVVGKLGDGTKVVGHSGGIDGFATDWLMTVDGTWTAMTFANADSVLSSEINLDALRMAHEGRAIEAPASSEFLPFDAQLAMQLAGSYEIPPEELEKLKTVLPEKTIKEIASATWSGDMQYILTPVGQSSIPLMQRKDGIFVNEAAKIEIELRREAGKISGFVLRQGGLALPYRRAK